MPGLTNVNLKEKQQPPQSLTVPQNNVILVRADLSRRVCFVAGLVVGASLFHLGWQTCWDGYVQARDAINGYEWDDEDQCVKVG